MGFTYNDQLLLDDQLLTAYEQGTIYEPSQDYVEEPDNECAILLVIEEDI
jgi:hypothetical protein